VSDALGRPGSVLVLGAGSDIARATVAELARRGTRRFVLAARDPAAVERDAGELRRAGAAVDVVAFDADALDTHEDVVGQAFDGRGDIDVVLVAFGVLGVADPLDREDVVNVFRTNTLGAASLVVAATRRLVEQGHGTVVVLSSVAAARPRQSNPAYGASKAAIDGFCEALGDRIAGSGVRMVVVRPGFVRTKMTQGMPERPFTTDAGTVGRAVADAIQSGAASVWVPRPMRLVGGVLRLLPRAVLKRVRS
jgi:decaprenylphospho-beta-D-erythro-pentofuranosid-2-ulose 2-reductase